jgi:hypothetical protein
MNNPKYEIFQVSAYVVAMIKRRQEEANETVLRI